MLKENVKELINRQVNREFFSAYLYLDFANYYHDMGLDGFANWYEIQAKEEQDHAMLMREYLLNNGEAVRLEAIDEPDKRYSGAEAPLKEALAHERYITGSIDEIYTACNEAKDYRTMQFLDWFIKEQGEEEKNAEDLLKKYELFGSDAKGLYALNQELAGRVYSAPSLTL